DEAVVGRYRYSLRRAGGVDLHRQRAGAHVFIEFFGPDPRLREWHLDGIGMGCEVKNDHSVLFGSSCTCGRMPMVRYQLAALQRLLPIIERFSAAKSAAR